MAGNARFHDKLHRKNHHTNQTVGFPDSASDPIASPDQPFEGDFVINGTISSSNGIKVLSAEIGEDIYCNNIHVNNVTYTNFISGNSTETIISDGALTGRGNGTLNLEFTKAIYGSTPLFNILNKLCAGDFYTPKATIDTLTVKQNSNLSGTLIVNGKTTINNDLYVTGNLSALGDISIIDTNIISTSALSVINHGTTQALLVNQIGDYATAIFQKDGIDILVVSGTSVTVHGSLSTTGDINGNNINLLQTTSSNWNSVYNTVSGASANWESTYNVITGSSGNWDSCYNIMTGYSANWESVYTTVSGASAGWDLFYNNEWISVYNTITGASGNWDSCYNTVLETSANWNKAYNFLTSGGKVSGSIITSGDQTLSGNLGIGISATSARLQIYDNSNNPAVKITQAGSTGHALYIEDQSPDSTPTVIDYQGHMGIGTTTPNKELTVVGDISANAFYGAVPTVPINLQTGTTYTIKLSDAGYFINFSNSNPTILSVPTNASIPFPIGTQMMVSQIGLGQVTVSAVSTGTTSINGNNGTKTSGQYAIISLIKIATDSWLVGGDATT